MRRRLWFAVAVLTIGAALWATLRQGRPRPEPFAIDESLPAGAVRRIGSRMFGRIGGPNRRLVELSPDGSQVYVCDDDGFLRAWDVDRGAPLWQVAAHADMVPPAEGNLERRIHRAVGAWTGAWHSPPSELAVSPDGRRLATCAAAMIRVFDAADGVCVAERRVERDVDQLGWSADGRRVVRTDKHVIAAWDVDDDTEAVSEAFATEYLAFAARPDGTVVVQAETTPPSPLVVLDGGTLARFAEIARPSGGWMPTLQFDSSGRELVAQWPKKPREKWSWSWFDPATRTLGDPFETEGIVWRVLEPERGRQRLIVGGLSALELVRHADGVTTTIARGAAEGGSLSGDARRFAWAAFGRARVHDLVAGGRLHADEVVLNAGRLLVLPDGKRFLAESDDASLVEIEVASGRVLRRFDAGGELHADPLLSADGRFVAVQTSRGVARIDLSSGATESWQTWVQRFAFRGTDVIGLVWRNQELCIVDVATRAETPLLQGTATWMGNHSFSADGERFRADLKSGTFLWDTRTGAVVDEPVRSPPRLRLEHAPRGGRQVLQDVGPRRAQVELQDEVDFDAACRPSVEAEAAAEALGTTLVAIPQNPIGARARRTRDARIVLVAADDGRTVATLRASDGPILRLAFVPGGRWLLSSHDDGTILVWDLTALPPR